MRRKFSLIFMIAILTIFAAGCGSNQPSEKTNGSSTGNDAKQEELTIKHQLGETKVKKNPEKVIVFDFGVLDTLDKLGVEVTGVPQANIPAYLSKYKDTKYENVGGLKEPDFEKISEIDPDLIIISGRQQDAYEELSEIAPTIFLGVDPSHYMESFEKNTKTLGEIFDKESEVEEELAKVKESIEALHKKASESGKSGLVILANEGNISAYGPGSRFGLIHDVFGVKAVDENIEVSTHGQNISFEYIVEKDPDYLFVIDRGAVVEGSGGSSAKATVENELVKNTKAYKNDNIVYLDPNYWYLSGGGLISVAEMVKEIEKGIE
jgi:iron complex transport system substrate-binding protein